MSPEHYFNDKSALLLHPGTRWNKNFASQRQNYAQKIQDAQVLVTESLGLLFNFRCRFLRGLHMKFEFNWPSGFRGEDV